MSSVSPVGARVYSNNTVFSGKKSTGIRAVKSIDEAYAKELKLIQKEKQDSRLAQILNPENVMENVKNSIQILVDAARGKK